MILIHLLDCWIPCSLLQGGKLRLKAVNLSFTRIIEPPVTTVIEPPGAGLLEL